MSRLFLIIAFVVGIKAVINGDGGVLVLTTDNFDQAVTNNKFVFVHFYVPDCGQCKILDKELAAAAKVLKEEGSNIKLGKVDVSVESSLGTEFGIQEYPTVKLFRNGDPVFKYDRARRTEDIVEWLKEYTLRLACKELKTVDDAKDFQDTDGVFVIGFFRDQKSRAALTFKAVISEMEELPCGIVTKDRVFTDYGMEKDGIVLFGKQFDEGRIDFKGKLHKKKIKNFLINNGFPTAIEYKPESSETISGYGVENFILLFLKKEEGEQTLKEYGELSKEFKGKLVFIYVDTAAEENSGIMEHFGIKKAKVPAVRLVTRVDGTDTIYKPTKKGVEAETIKQFVHDFLDGKLKTEED